MTRISLFAVAGLAFGCNQDIKTPFPAGLEPLEKNKASYPSGGGHPEELSCKSGFSEDADFGEYTWVHCKTYIRQPIANVYDAFQMPRVVADRRALDEMTVEWDVEPEYDHSFLLHNTVFDIITVEFDVSWRHGALDAVTDAPQEVGTRWQKTFGSEVIELLRGSIYTHAVEEDVTGLEIVFHQKSMREDEPLMMDYLRDLQADIQAASGGDDLPSYESGV